MDWGDARYYGLDSASLQNAAGQFVAPSVASVQAEVAAEPIAKAGYATPAPTLAVKGGYPMSTVIDALIPDSPLAPSVSKPISEMVNELLNYTTTAASLPDGYVPLPPKLAALAHTELAAALKAENAPVTATTTTTASVSSHSVTFGASVTYEATVAATSGTPTGTVEFDIGSKVLCKAVLSGATASCSSAAAPTGKDTIKANYLGTTGFASSSATATLEVSPATVPTTTAPTTTVPTTTMPPTTVPTSTLPPTTVPPTTAPVTTVPAKKPSSGNLSIADVTLSSTAAEGALPATLAVGGSLIALSLGFTFLGTIRRRRSGGNARA
jgi:carboxypeptidase N regulatory subunit